MVTRHPPLHVLTERVGARALGKDGLIMKRPISLVLITATLLSLLGANTSDPEPHWGETVEGCRLNLTADRDQYQFGDPIKLHVVLQNVNRPNLPLVSSFVPYDIDVFSSRGPVPLTL
jgi:hypothetical protein